MTSNSKPSAPQPGTEPPFAFNDVGLPNSFHHASLTELASLLHRPLKTLEVLQRDPFTADRPARRAGAEWFVKLWRKHGRPGLHVHGFHYILVSQAEPVPMRDGRPYENTKACEAIMLDCALDARYLGLIRADEMTDQRNPDPAIHDTTVAESAVVGTPEPPQAYEPPALSIPELTVWPPTIRQRYLLEIWIEKSTMDSILVPLCDRHGINLQTGVGEISHTRCVELVNRAIADGRPTRILYGSDFDPAGGSIPVAAARKIEFLLRSAGHEADIQLRPIVLTHDQCIEHRLPRTPLKDTEGRAGVWQERFGKGATELDALEALRPGVLKTILETEIARYRDDDLNDAIAEVECDAESDLAEITEQVHERHAAKIAALRKDHKALLTQIGKFNRKAGPVLTAIERDLNRAAPDADDYNWPEPADGDEDDDPLFDSTRDYIKQIDRFKGHQGKRTTRKIRNIKTISCTCSECGEPFMASRPDVAVCSAVCRMRRDRRRRQ